VLSLLVNEFDANRRRERATRQTSNWTLRENDLFSEGFASFALINGMLHLSLSLFFFSPEDVANEHYKKHIQYSTFRSHFSGRFFLIMKLWLETYSQPQIYWMLQRCSSKRLCFSYLSLSLLPLRDFFFFRVFTLNAIRECLRGEKN
jgi:hypothetical protein